VSAQRFRKKPVEVEAWQATGAAEMGRIVKWINANGGKASYRPPVNFGPAVDIATLEGTMEARVKDWIIRGIQNEFYPCKPDIFEATYDALGLQARS